MAPLCVGPRRPAGAALILALLRGGSAFRMVKKERSGAEVGLEAHLRSLQAQVKAVEASTFSTYSVIFKKGTTDDTIAKYCQEVGNCKTTGHPDEGGIPFAVMQKDTGSQSSASPKFGRDLASIEPNMEVVTLSAMGSGGSDRAAQQAAPKKNWGLEAMNVQRNTGRGVHVYMIDTGVRLTHQEFGGRAFAALEVRDEEVKRCSPSDVRCAADKDGHGTMMAGAVAGATLGVAPGAAIWACKPDPSSNGIYLTIDYISQPKNRKTTSIMMVGFGAQKDAQKTRPMVADFVIDAAMDRGIIVVVAAGNGDRGSSFFSPQVGINTKSRAFGAQERALVVGSVNATNHRSSFSNFGPTVDIFAPGEDIACPGSKSDTDVSVFDGTEVAAAMVAGAAALVLEASPQWHDQPDLLITQLKKISQRAGATVVDGRSTTEYGTGTVESKTLRL